MDLLEQMIAEKYISVQKHPEFDLYIYNYTHRAQFDRVWNEETLQCRGLIKDGAGNIVSRPFRKFFNWGEIQADMEVYDSGPPENHPLYGDFTVTEKMDGSLGISYFAPYGQMFIATRGSFVSDQAKWANKWLINSYLDNPLIGPNPDFTYLFEIIYPENRIVVNYGDRKELVLLAIIQTSTGLELPYHMVQEAAKIWNISVVPRYDGITDFTKIEQKQNSEGYVVHFTETGLRFKIKFDEYVRLHKILTGINAKRVWEILKSGDSIEFLLEKVPDEFYQWVKKTVADLQADYYAIELSAKNLYEQVEPLKSRKEQALTIQGHPWAPIVFRMLDGKDYSNIIWSAIEPEFEKPFKVDEE